MAVVEKLAEAVTVTDPDGRTVYANEAAVELLRLRDVDELLGAPPGDIMDRFAVYDEDGSPLELADLPSARMLAGERERRPAARAQRRARHRRGALADATRSRCCADPDGEIQRIVNVIEDVTTVKRAERAQRLLADASEALARRSTTPRRCRPSRRSRCPSWPGAAIVEVLGARPRRAGGDRRRAGAGRGAARALRRGARRAPRRAARRRARLAADRGVEAGGETLGLLSFAQRGPGPRLRRRRGGARTRARVAAPASRCSTRACTRAAPRSPRRSSTGCCRRACPRCRAGRPPSCTGPAGEFNEVGGDFYDVFEGPDGLDGRDRRRRRPGRRGGHPDLARPLHRAHRRRADRRRHARHRPAQRHAARRGGAAAVHGGLRRLAERAGGTAG